MRLKVPPLIVTLLLFPFSSAMAAETLNAGDTAWVIVATALVMMMTPAGLALFYGGMSRYKNILNTFAMTIVSYCIASIIWVVWGYTLSFGPDRAGIIGGLQHLFLNGIDVHSLHGSIPTYVFVLFQMTFAGITVALILGAIVDRMKFSAWVVFTLLWVTFVYCPLAHWVWGGGWMAAMGALDFAGGTVVHINAGIAALVGALVIGKRKGFGKENMAPHSMTLTMVGAAMLWFGWFGFNAGSNLEANGGAALALINTFTATAGAIIAWSLIEGLARGKASMLGAVSGMVAGLVAVTPAAGSVGPVGAIVLGMIASLVCYFFVTTVKNAFGYDDSLDVFGIHGIGGIIGAVGTGIFTAPGLGGVGGADYSLAGQTFIQIKAVLITIVWSGVASFVLYKLVDMLVGLRVDAETESQGLDLTSHGEVAYNH